MEGCGLVDKSGFLIFPQLCPLTSIVFVCVFVGVWVCGAYSSYSDEG